MENLSAEKSGGKPVESDIIVHAPTAEALQAAKPSAAVPAAQAHPKITPQSARQGIVLAEILGAPLSKRRRYGRWR